MKAEEHKKRVNPEVISFLTLRRAIGILGMALPVILVVGSFFACNCTEIQISISNYYHTCMRNIFVGIICATGLFLFSYKGYELRDNIAGYLGCFFALGVAWLPTTYKGLQCNYVPNIEYGWVGYAHLISALLFFTVLIYFSLVLFTKKYSDASKITKQKKNRNKVYHICAYVMIVCIGLVLVFVGFFRKRFPQLDDWHFVFWMESISLWAFGISWLTKGEVLWRDANGSNLQ